MSAGRAPSAQPQSASCPPVVIGVGNRYRQDDAIGLVVLDRLRDRPPAGVRLASVDGDPVGLIELWQGARLAIVVDAVRCTPSRPGRIHRSDGQDLDRTAAAATSHTLGVPAALELAAVLDQVPGRLIVFAVEAAELGLGVGLSPAVAAVVDEVTAAVLEELDSVRIR